MQTPSSTLAGYRWLRGQIGAFAGNRRGAVAAFIAAAIIPLVGALGLATDTARGYMVRAKLGEALDAAALAGGKNIFSANRDADINMYFDANFPAGWMQANVDGPIITVNDDKTVLHLAATATIPTTFMRVLGFQTMTIAAETEVTRQVDMLDLVITIDMSGSMGQPMTKIAAARDAANSLVDILYGSNTVSPTFTVDGTVYNLLNIGLVTWNHKANVKTNGAAAYNPALTTTTTVPAFTNPVTGAANQTLIYHVNNSEVPLLKAPAAGWAGCVYARYYGDADNTNDADLYRGDVTLNGKVWHAWYPIDPLEGEPVSGNYTSSGNGSGWNNTAKSCQGAYWNDQKNDPDKPTAVANQPAWWQRAAPTIDTAPNNDCAACLSHGITPLNSVKATIHDAINALTTPAGNTNIPTGLAWAWEVLMPGDAVRRGGGDRAVRAPARDRAADRRRNRRRQWRRLHGPVRRRYRRRHNDERRARLPAVAAGPAEHAQQPEQPAAASRRQRQGGRHQALRDPVRQQHAGAGRAAVRDRDGAEPALLLSRADDGGAADGVRGDRGQPVEAAHLEVRATAICGAVLSPQRRSRARGRAPCSPIAAARPRRRTARPACDSPRPLAWPSPG